MKTKPFLCFLLFACAVGARAELVHVYERTVAGATTNQLSDTILATGSNYVTQAAPAMDGWIFTHWSISTAQEYNERDRWGRARDAASFTLYEETTLTANYRPASQDSDADGVADGHELYWYGSLAESASSDTDGDGFTFSEELVMGTNPLFFDEFAPGGIEWADSPPLLYNPFGYQPYVLRSDPEASLFATSTNWVRPDTVVTTPSCDHDSTTFCSWAMNGTRQADRWGRALDAVTFTMPSNAVELVAVTSTNELDRQALYWYGTPAASVPSDTDGDGFTFAEELVKGTNPLFFDEFAPGGIEWADSELLLYNPFCIQPYVIRSEPAGALFESATNWVRAGTALSTEAFSPSSSAFAYWTMGDAEQRDRWGRAFDAVSFSMPSNTVELVAVTETNELDRQALYWYGTPAASAPSDSDGDGFTFAEELVMGTNPLFFDEFAPGGIEWADSALLEANLQPFEQLTRGLVGGEAVEIFRSNWERNDGAMQFGADAAVAVVDANGDGLEDLLVAGSDGAGGMRTTLLLNGGTAGSPDFTVSTDPWPALSVALEAGSTLAGGDGGVFVSGEPIRFFDFATGAFSDTALSGVPAWFGGELYALDVAAGTVATTNGVLALDTRVVRGVSLAVADADHDGRADLLVTDEDGRVWFYGNDGDGSYTLQHKVWGGSFGGFAEGLRIAALDWNADGNLDAVGATADGTLVLLRDPRVGVPANLRLAAGLTSVSLEWDPSAQSRVRGYRVYRGPERTGDFDQLTTPWTPLPFYRDYPEVLQDWWYRVTSVGRFYTTGNSAPTFIESAPTEAQVAHLGGIRLFVRDANGVTGQEVEITVAIENSLGMAARDLSLRLEYDAALLEPRRVLPSGLTEAAVFSDTAADGVWTVAATDGTVDPGAGTLFTFVFYVVPQHVADETTLAITQASAQSVDGRTATIPLPASGTLSIFDSDPPVKPDVAVGTCVRSVFERETVSLPVVLSTDRPLDAATVRIAGTYDSARLAPVASANVTAADGVWTVSGLSETVQPGTNAVASLVFTSLDVAADTRTALPVTTVAAVSTAGVAASAAAPDPFIVQILNNAAFDPVHATFLPGSASAKIGTEGALPVAVRIDAPLDGAAWSVSGTFDTTLLSVLGAVPFASGCTVSCTTAGGAFTVSGTGGALAAGADAQTLFALRVKPVVQYTTRTTRVVFDTAAATATDGRVFETALGAGGDVTIRFSSATDAPTVSLDAWAGEVVERQTVSVPIRFSTSEALDRGLFALSGTFDTARLEAVRIDAANGFTGSFGENGTWSIAGTAGVVPEGTVAPAALVFRAKDVTADSVTLVHATSGTAVSTEGLEGGVPAASWSVLVKNDIAFDPADAVFLPGSAATRVGVATTLPVAIRIDAPLDGAQWSIQGSFDPAFLDVTGVTAAAGLSVSFSKSGGTFTVRGTGGSLAVASGSQALFALAVTPAVQYTTRLASIAFRNASAKTPDGRTFEASVAAGGDIALRFSDSDEPPIVSFRSGAREVVERERVTVPIVLITTDVLDVSTLRVSGTYSGQHLHFVSAQPGETVGVSVNALSTGTWTIAGISGFLPPNSATTLATLVFDALDVEEDTTAFVEVATASAASAEALPATVRKASPIVVTILNNPAYDPVHATFLPGTASAKIGTEAALPVSVQIDAALDGAAWTVSGTYDATLLDVLGASSLASGLTLSCTATNGAFAVSGTGGLLAAKTAAQPLFALRVRPAVQYTTRTTAVAFSGAFATAADGREFIVTLGSGGNVAIHFSDSDQPPVVSFPATAVEGYERREVSVPVRLSTSDTLNRARLAVEGTWDTNLLEWVRFDAAEGHEGGALGDRALPTWQITGRSGMVPAGTVTLGTLVFRALDVVTDSQTQVLVTGGAAESAEGIAAAGIPSASFGVLVKNDPAFDPIHATFAMRTPNTAISIGAPAITTITATFDEPIDGSTLVARIRFDPTVLAVHDVTPHVNGFSLVWSVSGGVLTVRGTGGTIPVHSQGGALFLFQIDFRPRILPASKKTIVSFESAIAKSVGGKTYTVDSMTSGEILIAFTDREHWQKGDLDDSNTWDRADLTLFKKFKFNLQQPTADQIKAGDFNGDGRITTADEDAFMKCWNSHQK